MQCLHATMSLSYQVCVQNNSLGLYMYMSICKSAHACGEYSCELYMLYAGVKNFIQMFTNLNSLANHAYDPSTKCFDLL